MESPQGQTYFLGNLSVFYFTYAYNTCKKYHKHPFIYDLVLAGLYCQSGILVGVEEGGGLSTTHTLSHPPFLSFLGMHTLDKCWEFVVSTGQGEKQKKKPPEIPPPRFEVLRRRRVGKGRGSFATASRIPSMHQEKEEVEVACVACVCVSIHVYVFVYIYVSSMC